MMRTALLLWMLASLLTPATGTQDAAAAALAQLGFADLDQACAALGGEADEEVAHALAILGTHCERSDDYPRSVLLREESLRMRAELFGPSDARTLLLVRELMEAGLRQGDYLAVRARGERWVAPLEPDEGLEAAEVARLLNLHAVSLQVLGEIRSALMCTRRALELTETSSGRENREYAMYLSNLANLSGELGHVGEARELALEALDLRRSLHGEDSDWVARTYLVLGRLAEQGGDFADAEEQLRRGEGLLRAAKPVNAGYLADALRLIGELALMRGDCAASESAYREARSLDLGVKGPAHPDIVASDLGIASALLLCGQAEESLPIFESASAASAAIFGAGSDAATQARIGLALALEGCGDVVSATELLRGLLAELEGNPLARPELDSSLRSNLARCLMGLGDHEGAEELLVVTIERTREGYGAESVFLVEPVVRYAQLLESRERLAEAEVQGRAAMAIAAAQRDRVLGADVERSRFAAQLGYDGMGRLVARLCLARGDLPGALAALEETRARTLLDGLLRASREAARHDSSEESAKLERLLAREEAARSELRDLEARILALSYLDPERVAVLEESAVGARNALGAATAAVGLHARSVTRGAQPASLARIRASLRADEVLLSFLWSEREVGWICVPAGASDAEVSAGTCARGSAAVREQMSQVRALADGLATDPRAGAGRLATLPPAISALRGLAELEGARRVYVVPDGPLSSLPFELLLGDGAREVVMLPSASTLVALADLRPADGAAARRAIVLGDPEFGGERVALARSGDELSRLPATRAEAEYVGALLAAAGRDVTVLTGTQASRSELEGDLARVSLLHLATHGFPGSSAAPFDAALALATDEADGAAESLTLDRLIRRWNGKLAGCELVVLSACDTNREVTLGTGLFSLATGFFQAGSQSVLASLWRVDEQATALLMGRFVENLTGQRAHLDEAGELVVEPGRALASAAALREAQTWLRSASRDEIRTASRRMGLGAQVAGTRSGDVAAPTAVTSAELRPYADPYFWAGFVLIGRAGSGE